MAAITICSDFGAPKIKSDTASTVSPSISHEVSLIEKRVYAVFDSEQGHICRRTDNLIKT